MEEIIEKTEKVEKSKRTKKIASETEYVQNERSIKKEIESAEGGRD